MKRRSSLLGQLLVAFSVFAVLVAIAAAFGYAGAARQTSAAKELTGDDYVAQQAAGRMQEGFTTTQIAISSYALSGRALFLRPLPAARAKFANQLAALRANAPASLRGSVAAQGRAGTALFAVAGRITRLPPGSARARALATGTALIARGFYQSNTMLQGYLAAQVTRVTVKFTPERGRVEVTAAAENSCAVIRVKDTGIGIPEQEQGKLFSRFFRASNARQNAIPGTGLGLTIVRTIVDNRGGEISLTSEPGAGAVATVRLPLLTTPG